jgi:hypothetical protein
VLWITPPATSQALLANYGGIDSGFGGGMAQTGGMGTGGGGQRSGIISHQPLISYLLLLI